MQFFLLLRHYFSSTPYAKRTGRETQFLASEALHPLQTTLAQPGIVSVRVGLSYDPLRFSLRCSMCSFLHFPLLAGMRYVLAKKWCTQTTHPIYNNAKLLNNNHDCLLGCTLQLCLLGYAALNTTKHFSTVLHQPTWLVPQILFLSPEKSLVVACWGVLQCCLLGFVVEKPDATGDCRMGLVRGRCVRIVIVSHFKNTMTKQKCA